MSDPSSVPGPPVSGEASRAANSEQEVTISLTVEDALRLENIALKRRLKQRELQDIEQTEAVLHQDVMRRYGADESFSLDLGRGLLFKSLNLNAR